MLFKLLAAPITAPLSGLRFVLQQVQTVVEREVLDVDRIHEELLLLQVRLQDGDITEDEYAVQEKEVMARLRVAREARQQRVGP